MSSTRGKIIAVIIALYSVFSIYAFPVLINNMGLAFLYLLVAPLLFLELYEGRIPTIAKSQKTMLVYVGYLTLLTISVTSSFPKSLVAFVISSLIYFLLFSYKGYHDFFIKLYLRLCGVFSFFLIIQYVAFTFGGIAIPGILSFIPSYEIVENTGVIETISFVRLSSVFLEPSHFALYVVPSVSIIIPYKKIKKGPKIFFLGVVSVATLLSTSGNGIILLALAYALFALNNFFNKKSIKNFLLIFVIVVAGFVFYSTSSFISSTTQYLFTGGENMGSKADYRIYRGFELFADLPTSAKLFGVGWKNAEAFLKLNSYNIFSLFSSDSTFDYFNSIAGILIYSGIVGAFLFIWFIRVLWKECSSSTSRMILIIMIASMFSSSIFMTDQWLLYMALIYASNKIEI